MRFFGSKITRHRTLPFAGGLSAQAQTYRANVIANGGTISDSVLAIIDTNLIKPLVASGDWAKLDKFHLYAGVGNAVAARTNMVSSSYYINPVNSPSWSNSTGYTGNGLTSYLDLNYNPSLGGTLAVLNSATIGYGAKYANIPQTQSFGARKTTATACSLAIFRLTGPAIDGIVNDATDLNNTNIVYNSIVLHAAQRSAASGNNCKASIINTNFLYANTASVAIPNLSLFELARNQDGTANSFDDKPHYYMFAGNGLIFTNNVFTAINNTLAALGIS
jgi:hypothetical protein